MNKKWTSEDEAWLTENYNKLGINDCANYLNRSTMSIQKKAGKLKLKAPGLHSNKGTFKTKEEYEEQLIQLEIDAFPLEDYQGCKIPILHECLEGHNWAVSPDNVLRGKGCPYCSKYGFQLDQPALVYYIKIGSYYKVGITNKSVRERFYRDRDKTIEILREEYFETGKEAKLRESFILDKYSKYRITVEGYLKSGGETELFESPVWL